MGQDVGTPMTNDPRLAALFAARLDEAAGRVGTMRRLLEHMLWADDRVAAALGRQPEASREALELYAHVVGTEQVWLARVLGEEPGPVWPQPEPERLEELRDAVRKGFGSLIEALSDEELDLPISYVNSAGDAFRSTVEDILLHTFLHGTYHRGQVALLLRKAGAEPAPTDYIALRRGAPAATRDDGEAADAGGANPTPTAAEEREGPTPS